MINYIKTFKGHIFKRVSDDGRLFYCEGLELYATLPHDKLYMHDAGSNEPLIYAGHIWDAY